MDGYDEDQYGPIEGFLSNKDNSGLLAGSQALLLIEEFFRLNPDF